MMFRRTSPADSRARESSPRRSALLAASLLALAAASAAFGFLSVRISADVGSAAALRAEAAATGARENLEKSVQAFVDDTADERAKLAAFVATDADAIALIQELENAAAREHVALSLGAIAAVPGDWRYHETLQVTLSAAGAFPALAAFATELESLPHASRLARITFERSQSAWKATATVEFLKEKSTTS